MVKNPVTFAADEYEKWFWNTHSLILAMRSAELTKTEIKDILVKGIRKNISELDD